MTNKTFNNVVDMWCDNIKKVLHEKNLDYGDPDNDERFHTFIRMAGLSRVPAIAAAEGLLSKHVISVYDILKQARKGKIADLNYAEEKFGDALNYLIICYAILLEYTWDMDDSENPEEVRQSDRFNQICDSFNDVEKEVNEIPATNAAVKTILDKYFPLNFQYYEKETFPLTVTVDLKWIEAQSAKNADSLIKGISLLTELVIDIIDNPDDEIKPGEGNTPDDPGDGGS